MKENNAPKTIRLTDYAEPDYLIDETHLNVVIHDDHSLVTAQLHMRLNPKVKDASGRALQLVGADLQLLGLALDDQSLSDTQYQIAEETLTIPQVPDQFVLTVESRIEPHLNTSLEGLYLSNGMFCTQCEAEGFRKITYYLDRPDVMSRFTTRIEADQTKYPVLLCNGNPIDKGQLDNGRHYVVWQDPFKKPCYLFALVAGDLAVQEDSFITASGREVALQLFVEPHDLDKCDHAMDSLKRSMAWDEKVYGREYDLDIYMIVAVSHFNMGAMENKGLNIFNTSCVLASAQTTTDAGFQRVEAVIAHEYFHNWSGNRVTCRDWFQLSLKEGFTVFRDQQFSADMGSAVVNRIADVNLLKTVQFAEDSGPMAHPVRPDSYIEINNFYTVTVYEKGAEVVRMIHRLLGPEGFRKGSDLYFERHDGQAVTCDDFVRAMEDANGVDFSLFRRWYSQAGTPVVDVTSKYDGAAQSLTLHFKQSTPPTPGQAEKLPLHIPVAMGLIGPDGKDLTLQLDDGTKLDEENPVLELTEAEQSFVFVGLKAAPVVSLFRGFSAPVRVQYQQSQSELAFMMAHDKDGYNRWAASQMLIVGELRRMMALFPGSEEIQVDSALLQAFKLLLSQADLDLAMVAKMLELPSQQFMAELLPKPVQVDAIHFAIETLKKLLAENLEQELKALLDSIKLAADYQFDSQAVARRSLRNVALDYLMSRNDDGVVQLCVDQYHSASNMTDQMAAFRAMVHSDSSGKQPLIDDFYERWSAEALVVDQWFSVQATAPQLNTLSKVKELMLHPAFELTNPNKVRALIGAFCNGNPVNFHREDGAGYEFLADQIISLNKINPQIASRMATIFTRWANYDEARAEKMKLQLLRIQQQELSPDVYEVVTKALKS